MVGDVHHLVRQHHLRHLCHLRQIVSRERQKPAGQPLRTVRQADHGAAQDLPAHTRSQSGHARVRRRHLCLRQFIRRTLQRAVLHRRSQQHPRLHRAFARSRTLPATLRHVFLHRPDRRPEAGGQRGAALPHLWRPARSYVPRRGQHLAHPRRPATSRGEIHAQRLRQADSLGHRRRTAL